MPSLAGFVDELLAEDMYGRVCCEKLHERVMMLNDSQLKGMNDYLEAAHRRAGGPLWTVANSDVLTAVRFCATCS